MAYEEANYEVMKKNEIYEIRKYSDRLAIEAEISNQGSSFRKLFKYISGDNESCWNIFDQMNVKIYIFLYVVCCGRGKTCTCFI